MKFKGMLFCTLAVSLMACSNQEELYEKKDNLRDLIEVVSLQDITTRTIGSQTKALKFENNISYQKALTKLDDMSYIEREKFFKDIDFKTAEIVLKEADNELDKIFDIEDDSEFLKTYNSYKSKYSFLEYNTSDLYDLSPYLPFSDNKKELLANADGIVVINNEIVEPINNEIEYFDFSIFEEKKETATTRDDGIIRDYDYVPIPGISVMIKQGKYQATMSLGVSNPTKIYMIRFAAQKKKKFWKRRHETTYKGSVTINGFSGDQWCYNKTAKIHLPFFGMLPDRMLNIKIFNFTSPSCPDRIGNETFNIYY